MAHHLNLSLTKCTGEQLDDLLLLSRQTFADAFSHMNEPEDFRVYLDSSFNRRSLSEELSNENSDFYFVRVEDQIAGYFKLNKGEAQTDIKDIESIEIERIYVLKDFQGQKIGQWMMMKIIEMTGQLGFHYLWLGVWEENQAAIRFYQKRGFKKFGEHPYYIGKDKQTDWLMRFDIPTL